VFTVEDLARFLSKVQRSLEKAASHRSRTIRLQSQQSQDVTFPHSHLHRPRLTETAADTAVTPSPTSVEDHWVLALCDSASSMGLQLVFTRLGEVQYRSVDKEERIQEYYVQ
jgi:hypothetical protein